MVLDQMVRVQGLEDEWVLVNKKKTIIQIFKKILHDKTLDFEDEDE
jgi:hypothetical protein